MFGRKFGDYGGISYRFDKVKFELILHTERELFTHNTQIVPALEIIETTTCGQIFAVANILRVA